MKNKEAEIKLAEAMGRLAEALEKFQDPLIWQKVFRTAVESGLAFPQLPRPGIVGELPGATTVVPPVTVTGVTVTLSDEERERIVTRVYEAVQPQLAEFNTFVKESLVEMPPTRLKLLAMSLEKGEKLELARRRGCVYIREESGEEHYLGL